MIIKHQNLLIVINTRFPNDWSKISSSETGPCNYFFKTKGRLIESWWERNDCWQGEVIFPRCWFFLIRAEESTEMPTKSIQPIEKLLIRLTVQDKETFHLFRDENIDLHQITPATRHIWICGKVWNCSASWGDIVYPNRWPLLSLFFGGHALT